MYRAIQKNIIVSPIKLREVVAMIKDLKPTDAVSRLPYVARAAAKPLTKALQSAIGNAKQLGINPEDLIFKEIQIGEGPRLKRYRAGARGRAKPYVRKMSHIRVVLTTQKDQISNLKSQINTKDQKIKSKAKTKREKKNV